MGINIHEDDPVSGTWNVIVISAHFASMLAAKERGRPALQSKNSISSTPMTATSSSSALRR